MQSNRLMSLAAAVSTLLALAACSGDGVDVTTPSQMHIGKIEVQEQTVTEKLPASHVDLQAVSAVARRIQRGGNKDVSMTAPYLPGAAGAMATTARSYAKAFAGEGVPRMAVTLVAADAPHAQDIIVAYRALKAAASPDCKTLPGENGTEDINGFEGYKYGCSTQSVEAKMVADPADLLGKASVQDNDSRRTGPIIEPYKAGTPNQELKGMNASKVGQ